MTELVSTAYWFGVALGFLSGVINTLAVVCWVAVWHERRGLRPSGVIRP